MNRPLSVVFRQTAYNVFHNFTNNRTRRHVITGFTKKTGLVYFGTVDQKSDEHRLVRGFTVSSTHRDNHYSVGSINDYDLIMTDRSDAIWEPDGTVAIYSLLIMAFELHTKQEIPHFLINANNGDIKSYAPFFAINPTMHATTFGTFEQYSPEFASQFSVYSQPSDSIEIERILPAATTELLTKHFWPLSAEQKDGYLYIYSDDKQVTTALLDMMLESGLWLANFLDNRAELV